MTAAGAVAVVAEGFVADTVVGTADDPCEQATSIVAKSVRSMRAQVRAARRRSKWAPTRHELDLGLAVLQPGGYTTWTDTRVVQPSWDRGFLPGGAKLNVFVVPFGEIV